MGIVCMERKKMNKELAISILRGDVLGTNEQTHEAVFMAIKALKAEPVRHGKWLVEAEDWRKQIEWFKCSECDFPTSTAYKYCPNCQACMIKQGDITTEQGDITTKRLDIPTMDEEKE